MSAKRQAIREWVRNRGGSTQGLPECLKRAQGIKW